MLSLRYYIYPFDRTHSRSKRLEDWNSLLGAGLLEMVTAVTCCSEKTSCSQYRCSRSTTLIFCVPAHNVCVSIFAFHRTSRQDKVGTTSPRDRCKSKMC